MPEWSQEGVVEAHLYNTIIKDNGGNSHCYYFQGFYLLIIRLNTLIYFFLFNTFIK